MKIKNPTTILCMAMAILSSSYAQKDIKIMSYNIRLDLKSDGENWWEKRKDKVIGLMQYYDADFLGCQEVMQHQLVYIDSLLEEHSYVGVGRDDGKTLGEYSCIFYNQDKYKCLTSNTFWLSPTPNEVSIGWDAAYKRVCTYGLFQHKKSKKKFWVFNAHLDHKGNNARLESVKLIHQKIEKLNAKAKLPIIITGDFNCRPEEEPYLYFSQQYDDARHISKMAPYGGEDTWNAFKFDEKPNGRIDYIFLSRYNKLKVYKFGTITDSYDLKYPSDHFPIITSISIP
jgi:endonuclease/exonuclease/phosphatase family metal-dependent hydrolase